MTDLARRANFMLRPLIIALLAMFLVSVTSAHVRETVIIKLQENGAQRIYETEAHQHGAVEVRLSRLKIGRKPIELRPLRVAQLPWPPTRVLPAPDHGPDAARAPPHQPRAPPFA